MPKNKDVLGDRQKAYENVYREKLPKGMPIMIRLDGRAFHTYTKGFERPFDGVLANAMWEATKAVCREIQGAKIGYTQSDEITIFVNNYEDKNKEYWYDNNLQKIVSVAASIASVTFNDEIRKTYKEMKPATFDARAWILTKEEVINCFIWRQKDATKNSISMVAQANFKHGELQGLNSSQMQDKLFLEKGINWNDLPVWQKRGVAIVKKEKLKTVVYNGKTIEAIRKSWEVDFETPIFSKDREYINKFVFNEIEEQIKLELREIEGIWFIEADAPMIGKVLLLEKDNSLPIPVKFETKEEAEKYMKEYKKENLKN